MYIDWYNPKRTIRDKEETFSNEMFSIDLRLFGFPIVCIDLCTLDKYLRLMILGFGFTILWERWE